MKMASMISKQIAMTTRMVEEERVRLRKLQSAKAKLRLDKAQTFMKSVASFRLEGRRKGKASKMERVNRHHASSASAMFTSLPATPEEPSASPHPENGGVVHGAATRGEAKTGIDITQIGGVTEVDEGYADSDSD